MRFKQHRARRIAAVRRQLADLGAAGPQPFTMRRRESFECGGRGHLISAASWLINSYLRVLHAAQSRTPTRSDYLLDLMCGLPTPRKPSPRGFY